MMPSLPALSIPAADSSLNAASLKQNEFPYRLQSAEGTLLKKSWMSPGTLKDSHVVAVTAVRPLWQLTGTTGCETFPHCFCREIIFTLGDAVDLE